MRRRVLIAGAAGRDFHNFNVLYRGRQEFELVVFTATQIPHIDGRSYPPALAGDLYPEGIPIVDESELEAVVRERLVDDVVFSYSDVSPALRVTYRLEELGEPTLASILAERGLLASPELPARA
jgi:predicted GTPase